MNKITIVSFGFRDGEPDHDFIWDARKLRNPHRRKDLRYRDGLDPLVVADVRGGPGYAEKYIKLMKQIRKRLAARDSFVEDIPEAAVPDDHEYTIAIGCHAGRHRSVVVAQELTRDLIGYGVAKAVEVIHLSLSIREVRSGKVHAQ